MKEEFARLLTQKNGEIPPLNETQRRITQAALDLFSERGFDGATTDAIARRAKVTEKTLFRHFGSKKRLFVKTVYPAMLRMLEPIAFEGLREAIKSDYPDLREVVYGIMSERIAFNRKHPEILKLLAQGLLLHPDFREAFATFWRAQILPENKKMLRRARERGEVRDFSDTAILRALISLTAGFALNRLLFAPLVKGSDEKELRILVDILMNGISGRPASKMSPSRGRKLRK